MKDLGQDCYVCCIVSVWSNNMGEPRHSCLQIIGGEFSLISWWFSPPLPLCQPGAKREDETFPL